MNEERFKQQIQFILEIDRLKSIIRRNYLINGERRENSAEHSWHLALLALTLAEYANEPVDALRVLKMVILHDIVEIDAGDSFFFDADSYVDKAEREEAAAQRLFGLLPADQAAEFRALWEEFEARQTAEARFANALDRLMPLLHNFHTEGRPWQENNVTSDRVTDQLAHMAEGSESLWQYAQTIIADAVAHGYLAEAGGETAVPQTEKEKMLTGQLYVSADPELIAERDDARRLTRLYNQTTAEEQERREKLLHELFGRAGQHLIIEPPFYCDYGRHIYTGDNVFMNFGCVILDVNTIRIGDNTQFGPNVQIYAATHPLPAAERIKGPELGYPITIGKNVWIGGGAIICPGVTVGDNTTIGAGSVVTRDIPADVFAAGNPCRVIREL